MSGREELPRERFALQRRMKGFLTKTSTFVSIDVVNSTMMKVDAPEEDSIFSFLAYQRYVEALVQKHRGRIVSVTGDGVMAQFSSAPEAVEASVEVLQGLENFNRNVNLLKSPFQLRIGVNTGKVYQDQEEGERSRQIMPSSTIDMAGYLQKNVPPNTAWFDQSTIERLDKPISGVQKHHFDKKMGMAVYAYGVGLGQIKKRAALSRKFKVLIIEDEPDQAFVIQQALGVAGYESLAAFDGSEGLILLKVFEPDIILLDIGLPRYSGWQILHELKVNKAAPGVPVLMLARRYKIEDVEKSFQMGASGCIMKPCDLSSLMLKIKILLS